MRTLPQVLKINFELQRKMSNEKITRKITFQLIKHIFFLWTPPTFKPHNFLIFYSL
jgi:hypothetical protein